TEVVRCILQTQRQTRIIQTRVGLVSFEIPDYYRGSRSMRRLQTSTKPRHVAVAQRSCEEVVREHRYSRIGREQRYSDAHGHDSLCVQSASADGSQSYHLAHWIFVLGKQIAQEHELSVRTPTCLRQ